jgi:hypothetical protein
MLRTVVSFDGHAINDGASYEAVVLNPYAQPAAQPVYITQAEADAEDAGTFTVDAQTVAVQIQVLNYASRVALTAQLQKWFKRGTLGDLVVTYGDDSLNYYKPCRVVNLIQDPEHSLYFTALLSTGWTAWRAVTAETYTWDLTGTGGSHDLALSGDDETPLSVTFELSGVGGGFLYQRLYQLVNAPNTVPALGFGPWCVTINTAALLADNANKCQVAGGGIDDEVTTVPYDTVTGTIPSVGSGYVGTEQITWTGKTGTTSGNLTGVTRGAGGTTPAAHADDAEIKLSYMQANCADLRIFINGRETKRWIASPNNAATKIWFNLAIGPGYSLALREALDDSTDYPYLNFVVSADTKAAVGAMPGEGLVVHGTEWVKYRRGSGLSRLEVIERGVLGTTKQAHAIGDAFQFIENAITVCYGNSGLTAPSTGDAHYDDTKPLFLLTSSDNASWVYDATTLFYDAGGTGRTGGFTPAIVQRLGEVSDTYPVKRNAASGDPAMGMKIGSFLRGASWTAERAKIAWQLYRACGIDTTTLAGEKYRTDAAWPAIPGLQISSDGAAYTNVWLEATPGSADTWTALATHSAVDMSDARWMRLMFNGAYAAASDSYALFEVQTGTIAFVSANLPTGTLLAQATNGQLDLTLENTTNEDAIEAVMPMLLGLALVLDGEEKTILYNNVNAHEAVTLDDESRDWWIRLEPGTNALTVTATNVGTLEAVLSWRRRRF